MIVRTAPERPKEFAFAFGNWRIIDAGNTPPHQTALIKLPILVAIGTEPVAAIVAPLISEAHREAVFAEGPKLFDQAIVEFTIPLAGQEGLDRLAACDEFGAVPPPAVRRVCYCHPGGIATVPCILGQAGLPGGILIRGEGWEWRPFGFHRHSPVLRVSRVAFGAGPAPR